MRTTTLAIIALSVSACDLRLPGQTDKKVTDAEKALLPTAASVAPLLEGVAADSALGKFTKDYSWGSHELDYEYESDDLMLNTGISVERNTGEAESTFHALALGMKIGLRSEEVERVPCKPELKLGDRTQCKRMGVDGINLGNTVIVRKGKRVLYMILVGGELTTAQLAGLLRPFVEKMGGYNP